MTPLTMLIIIAGGAFIVGAFLAVLGYSLVVMADDDRDITDEGRAFGGEYDA